MDDTRRRISKTILKAAMETDTTGLFNITNTISKAWRSEKEFTTTQLHGFLAICNRQPDMCLWKKYLKNAKQKKGNPWEISGVGDEMIDIITKWNEFDLRDYWETKLTEAGYTDGLSCINNENIDQIKIQFAREQLDRAIRKVLREKGGN